MVNENSGDDKDSDLEECLTRHMEEFGHLALGDSKMLKSLMLKSLMSHYPEVDLGALRITRELSITHALLMVSVEELLRPAGLSWSKLFILLWLRAIQDAGEQRHSPDTRWQRCSGEVRSTIFWPPAHSAQFHRSRAARSACWSPDTASASYHPGSTRTGSTLYISRVSSR